MTELYQCPYDKATKCSLEKSCRGCEKYNEHLSISDIHETLGLLPLESEGQNER